MKEPERERESERERERMEIVVDSSHDENFSLDRLLSGSIIISSEKASPFRSSSRALDSRCQTIQLTKGLLSVRMCAR